jgi:HEAT repeat protein
MGLLSASDSFTICLLRLSNHRLTIRSIVLGLLVLVPAALLAAESKPGATLPEAQAAFQQHQYDRVLSLVEPLIKNGSQDARRLKIRSLIRLGRPADALADYDRLETHAGRDQSPLLREVAIGFILAVLKDMREQMRGAAYTALKDVNSDEMIPYLEDGLSDGSGLVRALAAEGLGRLQGGRRSVRLRKAVEDQAAIVRVAVLKALGRSGDRSVVDLVERSLKDEQPIVRVAALGALVMLGRSEAWDRLLAMAGTSNPEERGTALRMLGDLQDRRALPVLQQALDDFQPSVRGAAAIALGDLGLPEAAPALIRLLNDPVPAVRASAAVSLGELAAPASTPALQKTLGDANPAVRAATVAGLLRLKVPYEEVADVVRGLTQNADPGIRALAGRALAKSGGRNAEEAMEVLRLLLDDPLPRPRIAAAKAVGQLGGKEARAVLKRTLSDYDEAVRATAGGALARLIDNKGNPQK